MKHVTAAVSSVCGTNISQNSKILSIFGETGGKTPVSLIFMERHQLITVGKDLETTYLGIKEFRPDVIHLVATKETSGTYCHMLRLISPRIKVYEYLVGPYDVEEIMRVCGEIQEKFPDAEFIYNLSEGTKIMAMAAGKVAAEFNERAIYITQDGYWIDTFNYHRTRLEHGISNNEYIRLYGNSVRDFEDVRKMNELDINTAYYVKKFIERNTEVYNQAKRWYRSLPDSKVNRRFEARLPCGYFIETDAGTLTIFKGLSVLFDSACRRSCELMFLGRWWEVVVADVVAQWKRNKPETGKTEIWRDVIFNDVDKNSVKNEVDLLVNEQQRLLLIECKSGEVFSADIFKIQSVRETYGGTVSKAILVSYMPLSQSIIEKCNDLGIHWFAPKDYASRINHIKELPQWLDEVTDTHEL